MCTTLMIAGHETTRNLIANGMLTLMRRPDDLQRLRQDESLLLNAIEEMLRYESPIQRGWRRIAQDTELHGQQLREGQLLYLMLGAANRDPRVFDEPDAFRMERKPNRHVAFGLGVHFCVGAPLSRLEAGRPHSRRCWPCPDWHSRQRSWNGRLASLIAASSPSRWRSMPEPHPLLTQHRVPLSGAAAP